VGLGEVSYLVRRISNRDDALKVPLSEDVLLQRYQHRTDLVVQQILEFQSWSNVIVLSQRQQFPLVFFRVDWNVVAVGALDQLIEVEPIDTTFWATIDDIGFVLLEDRVRCTRLNALARTGDSKNAPIIARDG
jgi:hypothetical protein